VLRYAIKRLAQDRTHPLSKDSAWREAIEKCLGTDALDVKAAAERKARKLGGSAAPLGLGDFFFDPDDPLHPDREEEE
jgi:MoxR-like ATPase